MYFRLICFTICCFLLLSCSGNKYKEASLPDFEDKTGCFSKEEIFLILKRQVNTQISVSVLERFNNLTKSCDGVFYLQIDNWKKANTRRGYVYVPILKIGDRIMINTAFKGKMSSKDSLRIKNEIEYFKKNAENIFNEHECDEIEKIYRYGVGFFPKGRL